MKRQLRCGVTTGSCAAAAAKAAAMLLCGTSVEEVEIDTPAGIVLHIPICEKRLLPDGAWCAVRKDAGDDPDVTNGLLIVATARRVETPGITVLGGEGVGTVTKKGLKAPPGQPAINPVPLSMIKHEVSKILPEGIVITISVPEGRRVAEKTFNPRLGIVGGISILGTTGIVKPMSEEAWKESIALELRVKKAEGNGPMALVFGNQGEAACQTALQLPKERIVIISNFVGEMLDEAVSIGIRRALLVGHMGKLCKVACGNFHTHSRVSDGRMELLCTLAALAGAGREAIRRIDQCVTTDAAEEVLMEEGLGGVLEQVCIRAEARLEKRVYQEIAVGCILLDGAGKALAYGPLGRKILREWKEAEAWDKGL